LGLLASERYAGGSGAAPLIPPDTAPLNAVVSEPVTCEVLDHSELGSVSRARFAITMCWLEALHCARYSTTALSEDPCQTCHLVERDHRVDVGGA